MGYPEDTKTVGGNVFVIILVIIGVLVGLVQLCEFINTLIYG